MDRLRNVLRKHKWVLSVLLALYTGTPQWIRLFSEAKDLSVNWLYLTIPTGVLMIVTVWWQASKPIETASVAWSVYDNLAILLRELTYTKVKKERAIVFEHIEKERGRLPDKGLDDILKLYLHAESERNEFDFNPYEDDSQSVLSLALERIRNYISSRYGGRGVE